MTDPGIAAHIALPSLLQLAIGKCHAFMLTQVFSPRTHNECLDVTIGSLPVVEDAPPRSSIAAPNAPVATNRFNEFLRIFRSHIVFNGESTGRMKEAGSGLLILADFTATRSTPATCPRF